MVPRMSVVRRPSQGSPVSFKRRPRKNAAPSSEPCRICSARKATRLLPTPTRHRASRQKPLINYPAPLLGSGSLPGSCDQGIGRLGVPCPIILDVYLLMAGLIPTSYSAAVCITGPDDHLRLPSCSDMGGYDGRSAEHHRLVPCDPLGRTQVPRCRRSSVHRTSARPRCC